MVSQCANPNCSVPFHYLRGGRLYRFEVRSPNLPCADVPNSICELKPKRATVYFWMCSKCSPKFALSFDPKRGIELTPLERARSVGKAPVIVNHHDSMLDLDLDFNRGAVEGHR